MERCTNCDKPCSGEFCSRDCRLAWYREPVEELRRI